MYPHEHTLALVEPTDADDASVTITRDVVSRGGTATVILLITSRVRDDIRAFADAEGLNRSHAEAIAIDRLIDAFSSRISGSDTETIIADSARDAEELLAQSARFGATSIVISPDLLGHRGLDRITASANIPVVVAPRRAA